MQFLRVVAHHQAAMRLFRDHAPTPVAALFAVLAAIAACGNTDRASGIAGAGFTPPSQGQPCTAGQVRECAIEIGRTGSIVDCARGEQTCTASGGFGSCVASGTTFKAVAPPPRKGERAPDLQTNAVGGSAESCVDNPCNPYCKRFDDAPDSGVTADAIVTVTPGTTITLDTSNVPGGFKSAGTLDGQCAGSKDSPAYLAACQFDMHCGITADGSSGCVPFASGASDGCSALGGGVDITAPVVCAPADSTAYRNMTVCNRGSADLTADLQCMSYPGNSPHYPDANPGAGIVVLHTGSTVDPISGTTNPITTTNPLRAGKCRTFRVPSSAFQSSGTESIMCNPPATGTAVTTTLLSYPLTAETIDFANKDLARLADDDQASATTEFAHGLVSPIVYASGTTNNSGFTNSAALSAAPDGAGAAATLVSTLSASASPATVTNFADTWTASSSSTFVADLAIAGDGQSLSRTMVKSDVSSVLATGFTVPGVAGTLSGLQLTIESANSDTSLASNQVWVQRASDDAWLYSGTIAPGTAIVDISLPYGALSAADLPSLKIYLGAVTTNYSSSLTNPVVRFGHLGLRARYFDPQYASIDATGYAWASPPAGEYSGLELTGTWRSSITSGAIVYVFAKKVDGTTVASATFTLPSGYVANTWTTSSALVSAVGLAPADLSAGLHLTVQAYPTSGGTIEVDAIGVRPSYVTGSPSRAIRFRDFGIAVPAGASNLRLTTQAGYKIEPVLSGDWISAEALSVAGSTSTLISSRSASILDSAFNIYQLGAQTITDPTSLEDPKLVVDLVVGRGPGAAPAPRLGALDYLGLMVNYEATVGASVAECNPHNNWTVNKANPPPVCEPTSVTTYPPWTLSRVFDGVCPVGTKARWTRMGYTSSTPAGTKIEFRFRAFARDATGTCPTLAAATADPPTALATAQLSPDTQVCSLTAPPSATCPVDLGGGLGSVGSRADCLQMDAHGVAATSPPASPTLTDWRVTYDCVPEE